MPKRTKKNRYMKKGGEIIGTVPPTEQVLPKPPSAFSAWLTGATTAVKKAASSVSSAASSAASSATSALQNTGSAPQPQRTFGGKRRRKGGEMLATPIPTAQAQVWVGGKHRKITCHKRHKHNKSCKSQTYKKKSNRKKRSRKSKFPFSESLKRLIKM